MIIVQTPLRISFLGGGTDFEDFYSNHSGFVLSAAIDKYIFVIVKERFDDLICVNYSRRETVDDVSKVEHELVREAMRATGLAKGVEITTLADIPSEGTGLGSSSSVMVGLLHALYTYQGEPRAQETLAREACRIEIDVLKKPIGVQDQYIATYGNMRFFHFNSRGPEIVSIDLDAKMKRRLGENLLLFYTGVTRKADTILIGQKNNIGGKLEVLREMAKLAFEGTSALLVGAFDEFGELLHRGWQLKKQLADGITNPQIEDMYEVARRAGALGGKITGAGGGGFLLLYCPVQRREEVRQSLRALRELPFHFETDGSKVIFDYRRSS